MVIAAVVSRPVCWGAFAAPVAGLSDVGGLGPGDRWAIHDLRSTSTVGLGFHTFLGVALASGTTLLAPAPFQGLHLRWTVDLRADQSASGAVA